MQQFVDPRLHGWNRPETRQNKTSTSFVSWGVTYLTTPMKNHILTVAASLAALAALTSPVRAGDRGDKVAAAIGGFIGGVIVGSHLDRDHRRPGPEVCPPPVVVVRDDDCPPAGYWDHVRTRVWVPARWVMSYDSCGRRVRTQVGGYYEYRTERVWVDAGRGHGRYSDHGRSYSSRRW